MADYYNKTISYYNENAAEFAQNTVAVDFSSMQNHFLEKLPEGALILDFGCGAGRDTKYFLDKGYRVEAIDGSEELVKIASAYTGISVQRMTFQELDKQEKYDGIWACASILHLAKSDLPLVINKIKKALKPGGLFYTSFKYGTDSGERNGRYFTNFTEESFQEFMDDIVGLKILEQWITIDARPGREDEKWLNLLMQKE